MVASCNHTLKWNKSEMCKYDTVSLTWEIENVNIYCEIRKGEGRNEGKTKKNSFLLDSSLCKSA